jgi:hypothetical protein
MIEGAANFLPEEIMIEALKIGIYVYNYLIISIHIWIYMCIFFTERNHDWGTEIRHIFSELLSPSLLFW